MSPTMRAHSSIAAANNGSVRYRPAPMPAYWAPCPVNRKRDLGPSHGAGAAPPWRSGSACAEQPAAVAASAATTARRNGSRVRPDRQCVRRVREVDLRMRGEVIREQVRPPLERLGGLRAQRQDPWRRTRDAGPRRGRWRLLEHDVGVGAAEPEGADAGAAWLVRPRPVAKLGVDEERARFEVDLGVGRPEVDAGRDPLVVQRQRGLDDSGHAGRRVQMADVRLERADRAVLAPGRCGVDRPASSAATSMGSPSDVPVPCASSSPMLCRVHVGDGERIRDDGPPGRPRPGR